MVQTKQINEVNLIRWIDICRRRNAIKKLQSKQSIPDNILWDDFYGKWCSNKLW